jgi:SAM-dependent methyltransferase
MDDATRKAHERRIYNLEENLDRPAYDDYWDRELYRRMLAYELDRDLDALARRFLADRRVLVLGAGLHDVALVRRYTEAVAAVNISEREVEEIAASFPEVDAFVGDAESLAPAEPYDAVYCHSVLHHLHPLEAVVDSIHGALVEGGTLLVGAEPGLLNPFAAAARALIPSQSHTPGERPFVYGAFHRALRPRFEIAEVSYYFLTSMVWPYLARRLPAARGLWSGLMSANLAVERGLRHLRLFNGLYWMIAGAYRRRD